MQSKNLGNMSDKIDKRITEQSSLYEHLKR